MFVPLLLICSTEFGCRTVPGPMSEDLGMCDLIRGSMTVNLGSSLPDGYWVAGSLCLEWIFGESV